MNIIEELLKEYTNDDVLIEEFANIAPETHKFGVDVRFHLMQPNDKKLQHGPRLKVYKISWLKGENFTISISDNPIVIGNWKQVVTKKELNILLDKVKKYKVALLNFWYDPSKTTYDFEKQMKMIDNNEYVKEEY